MTGKSGVIWTMKELTLLLRERQLNKFDVNLGVSGKRGDGKSTFLFKIFNSYKKYGFIQKKQQIYKRDDIMNLLSSQKFGYCWDDEAINSGYKRDFQNSGQKELIKLITNFRDNYNLYGSALPFFYSLDKDLRELIFIHIHIIERGLAVILMPLEDQIHLKDPWDTENNKKIEVKEIKRLEKNPDLKFRYHKFTTFAGYVYFTPMTTKQERYYKAIKDLKRGERFADAIAKKNELKPFIDRVYDLLLEGKLSNEGLIQSCFLEKKRYTSIKNQLSQRLRNDGNPQLVKDLLLKSSSKHSLNNEMGGINELVPTI